MTGEEVFAGKFELQHFIALEKQEKLRELIYKTNFNLADAYMYHSILEFLQNLEESNEGVGLVFVMAAISFSVTLRKIIDTQSKANLRRLANLVYKEPNRTKAIEKIDKLYANYRPFIDQQIVHQDLGKVTEMPEVPGYIQNKVDLDMLNQIYEDVCEKVCIKYLKIKTDNSRGVNVIEELFRSRGVVT